MDFLFPVILRRRIERKIGLEKTSVLVCFTWGLSEALQKLNYYCYELAVKSFLVLSERPFL